MRVLFTSVDPVEVGRGHYTHVKEIVEGFEKRGAQVTMLFGYEGNPAIKCTGGFINTRARLARDDSITDFVRQYRAIMFIKRYLKQHEQLFDIIYGRDWIVGELDSILNIPSVSEFNGVASQLRTYKEHSFLNRLYSSLLKKREKRALSSSSQIICVSDGVLLALKNMVSPNHHGKMDVIENGVNLEMYTFNQKKFIGDRIKIAFIGSFSYWHGVEYIAPAILPILSKYRDVDLLLIGDGPQLAGLRKQFAIYRNTERVQYTGRISVREAANTLCKCHIGFAPHRDGVLGSPLKIREYCAAGLVQVTSKIQGTQFLKDNALGVLVTPGDVPGFQLAMEKLVRNRTLISEMGITARKYAENFLGWDSKIDSIYDICKSILA